MSLGAAEPLLVAGVMSGTSADGVDVVLARLCISDDRRPRASVETLALGHTAYTAHQRAAILRLCTGQATLEELTLANVQLGQWLAQAALETMAAAGRSPAEVDLVASHGQTVYHLPPSHGAGGATLQLGAPAVIAARTGITTVGGFRLADMALGGHGAPLAPYADLLLFGDAHEGRVALNLGGIANLSVLPPGCGHAEVIGFDSGPANMVIDACMEALTGGQQSYDRDGRLAAMGTPHEALLADLLANPFFHQPPPRSTGRERFGLAYSSALLGRARQLDLSAADIVATATALTARSIARAYRDYAAPLLSANAAVIAAGGGVANATLMTMLARSLPPGTRLETSDASGVQPRAREALAFAILGYQALHGRPNNVPSVTGATGPAVLGEIAPGANYLALMRRLWPPSLGPGAARS